MQTYTVTVTVTQPPSTDATLRDLVLSHGTTVVPLTPGFMPETKAYTATVDSAVTQGTVTATTMPERTSCTWMGTTGCWQTRTAERTGFRSRCP